MTLCSSPFTIYFVIDTQTCLLPILPYHGPLLTKSLDAPSPILETSFPRHSFRNAAFWHLLLFSLLSPLYLEGPVIKHRAPCASCMSCPFAGELSHCPSYPLTWSWVTLEDQLIESRSHYPFIFYVACVWHVCAP